MEHFPNLFGYLFLCSIINDYFRCTDLFFKHFQCLWYLTLSIHWYHTIKAFIGNKYITIILKWTTYYFCIFMMVPCWGCISVLTIWSSPVYWSIAYPITSISSSILGIIWGVSSSSSHSMTSLSYLLETCVGGMIALPHLISMKTSYSLRFSDSVELFSSISFNGRVDRRGTAFPFAFNTHCDVSSPLLSKGYILFQWLPY